MESWSRRAKKGEIVPVESGRPLPADAANDYLPTASLGSFCVSLNATAAHEVALDDDALQLEVSVVSLTQRYRLMEKLGRGGFGEVWKAFDSERNELVAIKGPRTDRHVTTAHVQQFLKEAEKTRHLAGARIVPVLDVVQAPTGREGLFLCFIVMKLMSGGSLADKLNGGERPTAEQSVRWIADLADALAQIHALGYIHRDIKPDNILFDGQGRAYFSDFGLAASVGEQLDERRRVLGTVNYMAPEQARGQHVDRQADNYSLGVVLYQLLALKYVADPQHALPYLAKSAEEFLEALNDPSQHVRTLPEQVPQRLAEIVEHRCLCDDKTRRYRSASELSRDLRQWLKHGDKPRRGTRWLRLAAPIGLALIGLALVSLANLFPGSNLWLGSQSSSVADASLGRDEELPFAPPRPLVRGTWNKLLDQPLEKLLWPGPDSKSAYLANFELEELTLVADGLGLLKAGELTGGDYHLHAQFKQPTWNGRWGVIYGLKPLGVGYECGRIQLVRWVDQIGKPSLRLHRDDLVLDQEFIPRHIISRSATNVPFPQGAQEVKIVVEDGQLVRVEWGNRPLDQMLQETRPDLPPLNCVGGVGLYVENDSLTVSQLRVFVK